MCKLTDRSTCGNEHYISQLDIEINVCLCHQMVTKLGCIYIPDNWIYTTLLSYSGANFTAPTSISKFMHPYCNVPLFLPDTITRCYKNVTKLHKLNRL